MDRDGNGTVSLNEYFGIFEVCSTVCCYLKFPRLHATHSCPTRFHPNPNPGQWHFEQK